MSSEREEALKPFQYEPLVGPEEAAKFLGYSESQIRKMARLNQIPAIKFGGAKRHTWRFYISALDAFAKVMTGGEPVISAQVRQKRPRARRE